MHVLKYNPQIFSGILIDHILHVTSLPNPEISVVSSLLPHIRALTKAYPRQTAGHFTGKLVLMHKNLKRGLNRDAAGDDAKTWPGLPELVFLRVLGALWPTSDMRHVVVSSSRLLMGSYLGLCKIRSLVDVASGLFLCTLFLQYENRSGRFVPEAINFLIDAMRSLSPLRDVSPGSVRNSPVSHRLNFARLCVLDTGNARALTANRPNLVATISDKRIGVQTNVDLLGVAVDLLAQFSQSYKALEGFIELYEPVLQVLRDVDSDVLSPALRVSLQFIFGAFLTLTLFKDQISRTIEPIQRLIRAARQARRPLCLQAHKPIPIPSYTPKFDSTSSSYLRTRDPDHERQEASKLRRQYKEERKGAIRELRKDARFLAGVEQEKRREKDKAYHERMKKVFGSIEVERAEEKALEREKSREKRRAGRK
jgi:nucleolar protein 14